MTQFIVNVNGESHKVDVDPSMPLLWVLRDELGYLGPKFGCGIGQCGACTVHIDGRATRSCIISLAEVKDKEVTTIEGLSIDGNHPVQKAWKTIDVPQCGYCQAGQMMTASAFLSNNPNPTREEIRLAMNGNLCRCATYNNIEDAVVMASENQ